MKLLRKILRYLAIGCLFFLTIMVIRLGHFGFSTPEIALQPLPSNLIVSDSAMGEKLLAESGFRADYPSLQENFVSQSRRAFCGVASSVIVLNSLHNSQPAINQSTIFNSQTRQIIHPLKVTFGGMTLAQLNDILSANQLDTELFFADKISLNQFRSLAQENLNTSDDLMLVNYQRRALSQAGGGHISPIAAYNQASDRFLILDVAAYKYPPVWVRTEELWQGMKAVDKASNRSRGFISINLPQDK